MILQSGLQRSLLQHALHLCTSTTCILGHVQTMDIIGDKLPKDLRKAFHLILKASLFCNSIYNQQLFIYNRKIETLGPLASFNHTSAKNLGVIFDSTFKFDKQISSVGKTSFFQLDCRPTRSRRAIRAFITTRPDYCNSLYVGLDQSSRPSACRSSLNEDQKA